MPEQTLGGIPLGLGMVMKINFLNFHVEKPIGFHGGYIYSRLKIIINTGCNVC